MTRTRCLSPASATSSSATTASASPSRRSCSARGSLAGEDVKVGDYGIRGYDLAYEILEGIPRRSCSSTPPSAATLPGTVYVIEADPDANLPDVGADPDHGQGAFQGHLMTPAAVFHLVRTMGGTMGRVLVVGCEPETFGPENIGQMELSLAVAAAVQRAVATVERLVRESHRRHGSPGGSRRLG